MTFSLRKLCAAAFLVAGTLALSNQGMASPVVQLSTSVPSPQPLGTTVTLTAGATDTDAGTISYRFEIGPAFGTVLQVVQDFSVQTTHIYTPTQREGFYQFRVTARNNSTNNTATQTITVFRFTSLVSAGAPVITPTANPLVALFSSPPCATGSIMRVDFFRAGTLNVVNTAWRPCVTGTSVNFLVAGMRAATKYYMYTQTWNGSATTTGGLLAFTTGTPPVTFPAISEPVAPTTQDDLTHPFVLMSTLNPAFPLAVDLNGNPVWYYLDPLPGVFPLISRLVDGGTILMITNGQNSSGTNVSNSQVLREIDLAGNVQRETNASRVSEQVSALSGIPSSCQPGGTECLVGGFHHEALRLSNGHTLVLSDEEKIFTDGTQGSSVSNPVDVIGDIIVDLDQNWQVAWYWRALDHLNVNRAAILGETCTNGRGCPLPVTLITGPANDWMHGNSLYYVPSDGSIVFSIRHQDWIIKIDYKNGTGTGGVLWTMGADGDFAINSTDPYPWFSHQHDAEFAENGTTILSMHDNGNTRVSPPPLGLGSGDSRGYVLNVDEVHKVVTPVLLADMGVYSSALGSAQRLSNGDYHFDEGLLNSPGPLDKSIEVFPDGSLGYTLQLSGLYCYRSFRLANLYTAP